MTGKNNAVWFFVALIGGGIVIWWTKSETPNAWIAAVVAAGVVFALTLYYILNDEDAPEEEGDNVYYLGLLFTLLSLIFTLIELFGLDTDVVQNVKKIHALLENFGIALTSTIAGIVGRVAVQNWQLNGSPEIPGFGRGYGTLGASAQNLEEFKRQHLGAIARDLTQGVNALARFHSIVRRHANDSEEHLHNHSEMLRRESAEFKDTLQSNADTFAQELKSQAESTLQVVGGSLDSVAQQAETLLKQLQSTHDDYLAEVRETTRLFHDEIESANRQSLNALRQNSDAATQQVEAFLERLQSASSRNLDAFQRDIDAGTKQSLSLMQSLSAVNERIGNAFDNLESGLTHTSNASAALSDHANQAAKSTRLLEVEVEKFRAGFAPLQARSATVLRVLDSMGEIDERIRASRDTELTVKVVQEIGEALRTITTEAATTTEHASKATELIDALMQSIQATEGETRRAAEALRALTKEAETQVENLRPRHGSGFGFWNRNR